MTFQIKLNRSTNASSPDWNMPSMDNFRFIFIGVSDIQLINQLETLNRKIAKNNLKMFFLRFNLLCWIHGVHKKSLLHGKRVLLCSKEFFLSYGIQFYPWRIRIRIRMWRQWMAKTKQDKRVVVLPTSWLRMNDNAATVIIRFESTSLTLLFI